MKVNLFFIYIILIMIKK